jgi:hypothetical protein
MPAKMSPGDRKVLLIAGSVFLILVVLGFFLAPSNSDVHDASSYSAASEGAKAAYLLLQESGYRVERWQRPVSDLKADGRTLLVIADPATLPDAKEKKAVEDFISAGGRVITNGIIGASFLPEDFSEVNPVPSKPWSEFPAITPSAITRASPKITLATNSFWRSGAGIPMYGSDEGTVITQLPYGKGEAIWLASATPFTNAGLKEPGNLEFTIAAIGDKQQTRILFDEYVHGYGEHNAPEKSHPLMTALLLQSIVLAAAALFTFSRRSGPLRPMAPELRSSPLEFVETLGSLYEQAHASSVSVDVYYQRFQFWITRRLGLSKDASGEEIDRAVRERWRLNDDNFLQTLRDAAAARYHPDFPQNQALKIVQSLHSYAVKLKLFPVQKEKS